MVKRSRHYCGNCRQKQMFMVDRYGPLACILFFPLLFVNAFRKPHCTICGGGYFPFARVKTLRS